MIQSQRYYRHAVLLTSVRNWCLAFILTYSHFEIPFTTHEQILFALFFRRWKPTLVLDQAAQIFDLSGVAGVAVDDGGKPDA